MVLKLYSLLEGPPSISVRQTLAALKLPYELINVKYFQGEHLTEEFDKMNPQKEIPVLDDDGFYLGESNAIMQYLCDKYKPGSSLYPSDPKTRAIVNHHLSFNLCKYYPRIHDYYLAAIFIDFERTPLMVKKVDAALNALNTYLTRLGTVYAAGDALTIADLQLINSTMGLETMGVDFSKYTKVQEWYNNFKKNHPDLWKISEEGMKKLQYQSVNRPDLSEMELSLLL